MADHRVDDLRLHLRTAPGTRGGAQSAAERFVTGILETVGDRLESRWPGRLVFLQRLQLGWKIADAEFADPSAASRYAEAIATTFGDPEPQRPGERTPERDVVLYRDEASWWACYLAALAAANGDADAWTYETLHARGVSFGSLAGRGRDFAIAVLTGLAEAGMLLRAAQMAEYGAVTTLCGVLGEAASAGGSSQPGAIDARLIRTAQSLSGDLPRPVSWLILYVEALQSLGKSAAPEEIAALANSLNAEIPPQVNTPGPVEPGCAQQTEWTTEFGGLFYLLSLALELEIGEALWKACLPEGAVLAHTVGALLGSAGRLDPAALLFGGVPSPQPLEVSRQQQEEIASALLGNLAAALPRRSLALLPELMLRLLPIGGTPAMVATERGSPLVVFAWPASEARSLEKGLKVFLAAWPASAPGVLGTPSIAGLEGGVRVRAAPMIEKASDVFTPEAGSPWASALIAQIAGSLAHLFGARAGLDSATGLAALVDRHFRLRADMVVSLGEMIVKLPLSCIDTNLRRAGLDRDPGWVPWLGRSVRFIFTGEGHD